MRRISLAVVRRPIGQTELLSKRWIIDLDGGALTSARHGRSAVWSICNDTEIKREDGLALIVQGKKCDGYDLEQAVLNAPDPAIVVVLRPGVPQRIVTNIAMDAEYQKRNVVVVGPRLSGAYHVQPGGIVLIDCHWDSDGSPVIYVHEEV